MKTATIYFTFDLPEDSIEADAALKAVVALKERLSPKAGELLATTDVKGLRGGVKLNAN